MATTAQGTTYVESTDLVSAYPTASLAVANAIDAKASLAMTQNAQTGTSYTAALTDGYKLVTMDNASANTFTVPPQSSVTWVANQQLRVLNLGAGICTITPGAGVTVNGLPLTLAQHKGGTLIRTASDVWTFVPFSSGSAAATVSGTTGSPSTGTGKGGRAMWTWTGNGSFTVSVAGIVRLVIVSGGRGGSGGTTNSGGGGGVVDILELYLEAGTYTVTVGAGGSYPNGNGSRSSVVRKSLDTQAAAATTTNTGDANNSANSVGVLTDISGSNVGYGGAGWSTTNTANYDSQYGGAQQTSTVARANSGGGGNEVGAGTGAAGCVILLA